MLAGYMPPGLILNTGFATDYNISNMYKNINEELGIKEDSDIDTGDIADITEANSLGNCHLDESMYHYLSLKFGCITKSIPVVGWFVGSAFCVYPERAITYNAANLYLQAIDEVCRVKNVSPDQLTTKDVLSGLNAINKSKPNIIVRSAHMVSENLSEFEELFRSLMKDEINRDNLLTDYRLNEADNMDVNKEKAKYMLMRENVR